VTTAARTQAAPAALATVISRSARLRAAWWSWAIVPLAAAKGVKSVPATVDVRDDALAVELHGADRLWALKSHLEILLANVIGAESAEKEASKWRLFAWRLGGTHIPRVMSAGRFYSGGKRVFWDVHHAEKSISIKLRNEHFDRVVIEVADPDAVIATIMEAVPARVSA
jgi:hypothetical protein